MEKQKEIEILQSLKEDTYFGKFFKNDIDQMCQNITNDVPIECRCHFISKSEHNVIVSEKDVSFSELEHQVKFLEDVLSRERSDVYNTCSSILVNCSYDEELCECIKSMIGEEKYLRILLENDLDLSSNDRKILLSYL